MTDAYSKKRRYLALWFPFLPADRLRIQEPDRPIRTAATPPDEAPLVLVAKVRGALRLCAVDARAQRQGITPGLTLADARAVHPLLIVAEMDEAADQHWLDRLARRGTRWSPLVTAVPPDGITLDIAGADHLFGGEAALAAQVGDAFAAMGMTVRQALAATPEAAQALARHAQPLALPLTQNDERADRGRNR